VPTLAAQTVLRVRQGKAADAARVPIGLRPLHLCGTRLEAGHQGLSRRYGGVEGEPVRGVVAAPALPEHRGEASGCQHRLPNTFLAPVPHAGVAADDAAALWLDPREPQGPEESSVPTLEASSAQVSGRRPYKTWAASAAFRSERGGLSEQRGWAPKALCRDAQAHRRLCAETSKRTEGSAARRPRKRQCNGPTRIDEEPKKLQTSS